MYKFVQRVDEIKKVIIQFKFVELVLDSIIILLMSFLIFQYIGIKPGWTMLVPSLVYAAIQLKYKFNHNIVKKIEELYPSLKERLSTVYDNKEEKNIVVEDLASSVLTEMEQMRYSTFISSKRLGIRVAIILALVAFMLLTASFNASMIERTGMPPSAILLPASDSIEKITGSPDTDIFNESSYTRIGNDTTGLNLYRGQVSELNIPGEKKAQEYSRLFPVEEAPIASNSGIYAETIPSIYQQIVRNYFTNLSRQE